MSTHTKLRKDKILVVAADLQIQRLLKSIFNANSYEAVFAADVSEVIQTGSAISPPLVIVDLDLPGSSGRDAMVEIRRWSDVPVIALSGRRTEAELVAAFDLGADDYIEKPLRAAELLARVRSMLRRGLKVKGEKAVYHCGALEVNVLDHIVTRAGEKVKLTPTEYEILRLLARDAGRVVSYRRLLESAGGERSRRNRQALRVAVWGLRQKIEDDPHHPTAVVTVDGFGYRLVESFGGAASKRTTGRSQAEPS
jgi:two-component system, OmpR family, KDP operon response regulator KdpE